MEIIKTIGDSTKNLGKATFASLKFRNYRLFFMGQSISMSGTWMRTVALGWLALELTGSGTQLGVVTALQFIPLLVLGAWGGVIVDRYDKRKMLLYTQGIAGFVGFLIGVLLITHLMHPWMIYVFATLLGLVRVFDNPARQTFVSEMVDSDHVKNAVSLNATVNNLARAIGPSIGGMLIVSVGIAFCFLINAISCLAVIIMLYLMRESELYRTEGGVHKDADLKGGFAYVLATPLIRNTLLMAAVIATFAYEFQVSLPLLAQRTFHSDASGYSSLMAAFGIGSVVGGLLAAGRHKIAPHHLIVYALLLGVSLIATGLMPTLALAILGMMVVGFFAINFNTLANTMLQLESLPHMRGRVMALWGVAMLGLGAFGGPLIGAIGEHLGARWGILVGGFSALIVAGVTAWPLLKKDTSIEVPDPEGIEDEVVIQNVK